MSKMSGRRNLRRDPFDRDDWCRAFRWRRNSGGRRRCHRGSDRPGAEPGQEAADPRPVGGPQGRPGRSPPRIVSSRPSAAAPRARFHRAEREEIATIAKDKPNIDLEITFDYNSADISAKSLPSVQALGQALTNPDLKGSTFVVAGHTDAAGGDAYNQDLSERRADSIKRYLIDKYGIAGDRPRDRRIRQDQAQGPEPPDGGRQPPRAGRQHGEQDHRVQVTPDLEPEVVDHPKSA